MNPKHDGDLGASVQQIAHEAMTATRTIYAGDPGVDVGAQLLAELASRGISGADPEWVAIAAREIRAGHDLPQPGPDGTLR